MKSKFVATVALSSLGVVAIALGIALRPSAMNDVKQSKAATYSITLDNSTVVSGLSDVASSGNFSTSTQLGNPVHWVYNNAKSNATGFIKLSRLYAGNSTGDDGYIANTDPITSLESIEVAYSGVDGYLTFYGSIDGTNFERVKTISGSTTITELNKYFYYKIASGEQHKDDLAIASLVFNYSCNEEDYIKDSRDAINSRTYFSSAKNTSDEDVYAASVQTTELFDSNRSSSGLVWTNNLASKYKYAWLYLPRTYTVEELAHATFVTHLKNVDVMTTDAEQPNGFTLIVDFYDSHFKEESVATTTSYPWYNRTATGWQTITIDLSAKTFTANVDRLRFCVNGIIASGSVYMDDFYICEQNSYPVFNYDYTQVPDEANDLTNSGISNTSSTIIANFSYSYTSSQGDRSLEIHMNNSYNWAKFVALTDVDLAGKIVTFDYIYSGSGQRQFGFYSKNGETDTYYYQDLASARTGLTVTTITGQDGRTWNHVVIDIDSAKTKWSSKTGSSNSGYQGIRHADAGATTYIDNLFVTDK